MNDPIDLAGHPRYRPRSATAGPPALRAARAAAAQRAAWWDIHESSRIDAEVALWHAQEGAPAHERAWHRWQGRVTPEQIEAGLAAMAAAIDLGPDAGCTPSEPWNDRDTHP